jgi:predicted O-methyltransferase YrrM
MEMDQTLYKGIQEELLALVSSRTECPERKLREEALGGSIKIADAIVLANILRRHRPQTMLEVGSFLGLSTRWLLEVSAPW